MKTAFRLALGLVLSAFFLWIVFRDVDFPAMWAQVLAADHRYTWLYCASLIVIQLSRIYRWDVLIRPFTRVSKAALFRIGSVGMMLILVLPLRLGEFARPYLLKKESGASMSAGMGSIFVERAIDGLLVTLLFFATTFYLGTSYEVPTALKLGGYLALGVFGGAMLVIVVALLTHGWVPQLIERLGAPIAPRITARVVRMLRSFIDGLRSLPDARAVGIFIAWTMLYWVLSGVGFYWMMLAFGWDVPVAAGFALVSIIVIGIMIPAGPGFLGTYHGAVLAGLSIFGIGKTEAAAYSMVVYPINVAVTVGFGLPFLFRGGARMSELVHASEEAGEEQALRSA